MSAGCSLTIQKHNKTGLNPVKSERKAMKNTMIVFVVLCLMSLAWVAATKNGETENQPTHAIFAAPCPGETGLWCVAIKNEGPVESVLGYGFEKRSDGTFQFVDRANVKTDTIKAVFPKDIIKNWGITPIEAILAAYNGEKLPEKIENDFNWFMLHKTSTKLNMWKSVAGDELTFTETVKKEDSIAWSSIWTVVTLALIGALLGALCKKYWHALFISFLPAGFFAMVLAFKINTLDDIFIYIDLIILFVLSTPIVAMLFRPLRAYKIRKNHQKNRIN